MIIYSSLLPNIWAKVDNSIITVNDVVAWVCVFTNRKCLVIWYLKALPDNTVI